MKYFYSFFFLSFFFISCDKKIENGLGCYDAVLKLNFADKYINQDITGDILNPPIVKYYKDSIRYKIITEIDTSRIQVPEIESNSGNNFYKILLKFNKKSIRHNIIVYFNNSDSLNLSIRVSDLKFNDPKLFQNDNLISGLDNCFLRAYIKL